MSRLNQTLTFAKNMKNSNNEQRLRMLKDGSKNALNEAKNSIENRLSKLKRNRLVAKVLANPIVLAKSALVVVLSAVILHDGMLVYADVSGRIGSTPHYYCDMEADSETKKNAVYRRYCKRSGVLQDVDENGIPTTQLIIQGTGVWDFEAQTFERTDLPSTTIAPGTTFADSGCGLAALSTALSYYTGEFVDPIELNNECHIVQSSAGSNHNGAQVAGAKYGIDTKSVGSWSDAMQALEDGNFVWALMTSATCPGLAQYCGSNQWTSGGHYILLIGILPDGTIAVSDSGKNAYTASYWINGKKGIPPECIEPAFDCGGSTILITPDELR